jgi:hypothetical protein
MRIWMIDEMSEKFDHMFDAAEKDGPQVVRYGDKTAIVATKEDYEDHLAGKSFNVDDILTPI